MKTKVMLIAAVSSSLLFSCSPSTQENKERQTMIEKPKQSQESLMSQEERCKQLLQTGPQVSSAEGKVSEPLREQKNTEQINQEIYEVPNRFPSREEVAACRKLLEAAAEKKKNQLDDQ